MKYVAAILFALAAALQTHDARQALMTYALVFAGALASLFAIERIVDRAVRPKRTLLQQLEDKGLVPTPLERLYAQEHARIEKMLFGAFSDSPKEPHV